MMPRKKQTGFTTYTPNTIFSDLILISKRRGGGEIPVGEREKKKKRLINQFSNLIYKTSDNQVMVGRYRRINFFFQSAIKSRYIIKKYRYIYLSS